MGTKCWTEKFCGTKSGFPSNTHSFHFYLFFNYFLHLKRRRKDLQSSTLLIVLHHHKILTLRSWSFCFLLRRARTTQVTGGDATISLQGEICSSDCYFGLNIISIVLHNSSPRSILPVDVCGSLLSGYHRILSREENMGLAELLSFTVFDKNQLNWTLG